MRVKLYVSSLSDNFDDCLKDLLSHITLLLHKILLNILKFLPFPLF